MCGSKKNSVKSRPFSFVGSCIMVSFFHGRIIEATFVHWTVGPSPTHGCLQVAWSNIKGTESACPFHSIATYILCNTELTSIVLFQIVTTNCCSHVLITKVCVQKFVNSLPRPRTTSNNTFSHQVPQHLFSGSEHWVL